MRCAAALTILLAASTASADQCRLDRDCDDGKACSGGACIDFEAKLRLLGDEEHDVEERRNWILAFSGLGLFTASWIGTIVLAGVAGDDNAAIGHAFVPFGGPVIMDAEGTAPDDFPAALFVALQGAGALAAIVGFTTTTAYLVPKSDVSIAPIVGPLPKGGGIAGVSGTF